MDGNETKGNEQKIDPMMKLAILGLVKILEERMLLKRGQVDVEKLADMGAKMIVERGSNVVQFPKKPLRTE